MDAVRCSVVRRPSPSVGLLEGLRSAEADLRQSYARVLSVVAELDAERAGAIAGFGSTARLLSGVLKLSTGEQAELLMPRRSLTGEELPPRLPATAAELAAGTPCPWTSDANNAWPPQHYATRWLNAIKGAPFPRATALPAIVTPIASSHGSMAARRSYPTCASCAKPITLLCTGKVGIFGSTPVDTPSSSHRVHPTTNRGPHPNTTPRPTPTIAFLTGTPSLVYRHVSSAAGSTPATGKAPGRVGFSRRTDRPGRGPAYAAGSGQPRSE